MQGYQLIKRFEFKVAGLLLVLLLLAGTQAPLLLFLLLRKPRTYSLDVSTQEEEMGL